MRPIGASAITLAGIALLWFVATRPLVTDAAPLTGPAPVSADLDADIPGVVRYETRDVADASRRDLFGYVEPPPPVIAVAPVVPLPVIAPPQIVETRPAEEPPPRFDYRYIGRFGHDRDPIVAFSANGEVRTVRRGDQIGEGFTLQSVGRESVEVVDVRGRVVRVRLGE